MEESLSTYLRTAYGSILGDRRLRTLYAVYGLLYVVGELYAQALPLYVRALGIPVAVLGFGKSVAAVLELLASPVAGVLADAHDRFVVAAGAGLVLVVAFGALALVTSPLSLVAVMGAIAVGRLALGNAATPAIDAALEREVSGIGWGVRDVAIYGGSAVGLGVGGAVVSRVGGVRWAFLALVPVLVVLTALLWWERGTGDGDPDEDAPGANEGATGANGGTAGGNDGDTPGVDGDASGPDGDPDPDRKPPEGIRGRLVPSVPEVPNPPVLARLAAVTGLSNAGTGGAFFLLPVFAADLGIGAVDFLLLFSGSYLLSAPLSVLGGVAADRWNRKRLYVGNFLVETLMLGTFALAHSGAAFLVGTALFVVQTGFEPAVGSFFFDQFDDDVAGTAWGIDGTVSKGAGVVAPAVGGVLYGVDPRAPFAVGAVLMAGATLVAATVPHAPGESA